MALAPPMPPMQGPPMGGMGMPPPGAMPGALPMPGMMPAQEMLPTEPMVQIGEALIPLADIERDIAGAMEKGHQHAVGLSARIKAKFVDYDAMKNGEWAEDDPTDPLVQLGLHKPYLARMVDMLKAQMVGETIPDPAAMDFFNIITKWPGLEQHAEAWTAHVRDKIKVMRPEGVGGGFVEFVDTEADDKLTFGNCFATLGHKLLYNSTGDLVQEGPCLCWIDPMNLTPWAVDVASIAETEITIYDPVSEEELAAGGYQNVERVLEDEAAGSLAKRDASAATKGGGQGDGYADGDAVEDRYRRIVYFGRWPRRLIHEALRAESRQSRAQGDMLDMQVWQALGPKYGFDPMAAKQARWWDIEWIGHTPVQIRPYPIMLPAGCGPVAHDGLIKRNGQFWRLGIYDRGAWDERLKNFYNRFVYQIAALSARPPLLQDNYAVDQAWLQLHGGSIPPLEPDMRIPTVPNPMTGNRMPVEAFNPNEKAIPLLREQSMDHDAEMRELTGATSAVEGTDKSKTATQASNNLAQSMSLIRYWIKRFESGFLRELILRMHVLCQQAMQIGGYSQSAPSSYDEGKLRVLSVSPEMIMQEALVDVTMVGANSPLNKTNQVEAFRDFAQTYMRSGYLDIGATAKKHIDFMQIQGGDELLVQWGQMDLQRKMQNIMAAFGPQGLQALFPPHIMQMVMGMPGMGMGAGMMGAAGAGQQGGMAGQQQGQMAQNGGMPQTQPSGPMGAPMMQGGGM